LIKRRGRFSVIQNHHVASPDEAASSDSMTLTCITDLCCPAPPCRDAAASASSCAATSDAATSPSANLVSRGMGDARSQQMQGTKGKSLPPWAAQRRLLCRLLEVPALDLWPWLLSALREFKWLAKSPEGSAWLAAQQCLTVSAPSGDEACWGLQHGRHRRPSSHEPSCAHCAWRARTATWPPSPKGWPRVWTQWW